MEIQIQYSRCLRRFYFLRVFAIKVSADTCRFHTVFSTYCLVWARIHTKRASICQARKNPIAITVFLPILGISLQSSFLPSSFLYFSHLFFVLSGRAFFSRLDRLERRREGMEWERVRVFVCVREWVKKCVCRCVLMHSRRMQSFCKKLLLKIFRIRNGEIR